MRVLEFAFVFLDVVQIVRRIRELVQMAAERGLRFFLLRPNDRLETALTFTDVGVASEEIHRARAETEQRREPRVVVVVLRNVAISAALRCADAAGGEFLRTL